MRDSMPHGKKDLIILGLYFVEKQCNLLTNTLNVDKLWHLSNHTQKVQQGEKRGFLRGDVNLQEKLLDIRDREHHITTR